VFEDAFGADPIVMLVSGNVASIFGGNGLIQMANAEGTFLLPQNRARGVRGLYGPTRFATVAANALLSQVIAQLQQVAVQASAKAVSDAKAAGKSDADAQQAGRDAATKASNDFLQQSIKQYPELAQIGIPGPTNPAWVSSIFLKDGKPKPKFTALVPDDNHILVTARTRPAIGAAGVNAIVASVRDAVRKNPIPGASVAISGAPVLASEGARALRLALFAGMLLGVVAIGLMLFFALRVWARAASRFLPLIAGVMTVFVLSGTVTLVDKAVLRLRELLGFEQAVLQSVLVTFTFALNPATLAALPIALGLSVDYAVQFLVRYRQTERLGQNVALDAARRGAGRATRRAMICTAVGLLALLPSGIPMVRQFGVVMILGAALAWVIARVFVLAALRAFPGLGAEPAVEGKPVALPAQAAPMEDVSFFGFSPTEGELQPAVRDSAPGRQAAGRPGWLVRLVVTGHERWTLIVGVPVLIAAIGWIAFPFSTYQTDPEKLISPNLPAYRDLALVRSATGSSGELDFILSGPDVTSPEAINWSKNLDLVARRDSAGRLKPLASLAQLYSDVTSGGQVTQEHVNAILALLPADLTSALLDSQHHLARIAYGVDATASLAQLQQDVSHIVSDVEAPPNYSYFPAGLEYLSVNALGNLQGSQVLLNLLGAALVLAALFVIYRNRRMASLAWLPTVLVAGWSTAVLFALRVPLTPMTGVLGALVVAFGSEFAILWLERYREARAQEAPAGVQAAAAASTAAGPGILISGSALALGFAALAVGGIPGVSALGFDLPMVRDFGLIAAMDIVLAVAAVLVVLPAAVIRFGADELPSADLPAIPDSRAG
jgi:predicted RND superfamily exporter protein